MIQKGASLRFYLYIVYPKNDQHSDGHVQLTISHFPALEIWRNLSLKIPLGYRELYFTVPKNRFRQHFSFLQNPAKRH